MLLYLECWKTEVTALHKRMWSAGALVVEPSLPFLKDCFYSSEDQKKVETGGVLCQVLIVLLLSFPSKPVNPQSLYSSSWTLP